MFLLLRQGGNSDPETVAMLAGILAIIAAGFAFWYGAANLTQSGAISRHFSLRNLKHHINRIVTIHGVPEPLEEIIGPTRERVLWYDQSYQEYKSSYTSYGEHSHQSWQQVDFRTGATDFYIRFEDGGRVLVRCRPTEIQDVPTRISSPGMLSSRRTIHKWLPLCPRLTVTGKLAFKGEGATIVPDRRFGLFFSRKEPAKAASKEREKGYAGLTGGALLLAFGVTMFYAAVSM